MNCLLKRLLPVFVAALLICGLQIPARSQFQVLQGVLPEDRTCGPSGNPWLVAQDLIIPEGITLTILPGTILKVYEGAGIQIEGGVLFAEGTSLNPIIFELNNPGNNNTWNGFDFVHSKTILDGNDNYLSGSLFKHVRILNAVPAISLSDTSILVTENVNILSDNHEGYGVHLISGSRLLINQSRINSYTYGMFIDDCDSNHILNTEISDCDMGIFFAANSISRYNRIENNFLNNNLNVGLFISVSESGIQFNKVSGNSISNNGIGLYIGNGGDNDSGFNLISNNIISNNINIGVRLSQENDTLFNNTVENNGTGFMLYKASGNHILNNIVRNHSSQALLITEGSDSNLIELNNIYDNNSGIKISITDDSIPSINNHFRYNAITGNQKETFHIESGPQYLIEFNTITSFQDTSTFVNLHSTDVPAPNNYWGTSDTAIINKSIFDFYDDDKSGIVHYMPVADNPSPIAPISKPLMVFKRLINNRVSVTWENNFETDLKGYKVYYGNPMTTIDNQTDTSIILEGVNILETIFVTAYDNDADGTRDQLEGHESAYAIAIAAPWAGDDTAVCWGDSYQSLTATAFEFTSLNWISDGDGTFQDATQLSTYYLPGYGDKERGYADLTLSLLSITGITIIDKMRLNVLEYLEAQAGNDTTLIEGTVFRSEKAIAKNYSEILWTSSGDGVFEKADSILTSYSPGPSDIDKGWVVLKLTISSECGTINDELIITIIPGYNIEGTVRRDGAPVKGAIVLGLSDEAGQTRAIQSAVSNTEGRFTIANATEGKYYIYAVPDTGAFESMHIPTYYATRYRWQDAWKMEVNADIYDVDIDLNKVDMNLPVGEGQISGTFVFDGDPGVDYSIYNREWFGDSIGTPLFNPESDIIPAVNHVVLLMNKDLSKILAWALTNENGAFIFNNLPYGEYRLWGEKAGFSTKTSPIIYISPDNNIVTDVELTVDQKLKAIETIVPGNKIVNGVLFPNPAHRSVSINGNNFGEESFVNVKITDERGIEVMNTLLYRTSAAVFGPLKLENLKSGLYLVKITSPSGKMIIEKLAIL